MRYIRYSLTYRPIFDIFHTSENQVLIMVTRIIVNLFRFGGTQTGPGHLLGGFGRRCSPNIGCGQGGRWAPRRDPSSSCHDGRIPRAKIPAPPRTQSAQNHLDLTIASTNSSPLNPWSGKSYPVDFAAYWDYGARLDHLIFFMKSSSIAKSNRKKEDISWANDITTPFILVIKMNYANRISIRSLTHEQRK